MGLPVREGSTDGEEAGAVRASDRDDSDGRYGVAAGSGDGYGDAGATHGDDDCASSSDGDCTANRDGAEDGDRAAADNDLRNPGS